MYLSSQQLKTVDRLGAGLSVACAIHCAIQPFLLVVLPLFGLGFLMGERVETVFLISSVCLASWALFSGLRMHGNWRIFLPLTVGVFLIVASRVFYAAEMPLAVAGALGIALSHFLNHIYQQQRLCQDTGCHS